MVSLTSGPRSHASPQLPARTTSEVLLPWAPGPGEDELSCSRLLYNPPLWAEKPLGAGKSILLFSILLAVFAHLIENESGQTVPLSQEGEEAGGKVVKTLPSKNSSRCIYVKALRNMH